MEILSPLVDFFKNDTSIVINVGLTAALIFMTRQWAKERDRNNTFADRAAQERIELQKTYNALLSGRVMINNKEGQGDEAS